MKKLTLIMKMMNMMKRPLMLIRWEIIMRLLMMMQLKLKQKIKSVKTPEMGLKYRQMSQNTSQMNMQRMNAQHVRIMSTGQ